jgi:hypothetical protein
MIRNSIMFCREGVDENIGGGRDSLLGKPMESIAVRLAAHKRLAPLEERKNAIERTGKVNTHLPKMHQRLIPLWDWTRPRRHTWDGLADKLPSHAVAG